MAGGRCLIYLIWKRFPIFFNGAQIKSNDFVLLEISKTCVFILLNKGFSTKSKVFTAHQLIPICSTGQIGYALVPMIARGAMLGSDQPVILHMLDIPPAAEALNGVKMELIDAALPLLKGMLYTSQGLI